MTMTMINLNGSEKQIAWATEIRNSNLKKLQDELATFKERSIEENWDYSNITTKLELAISQIGTKHPEAAWWIDHKGLAASFISRLLKP